MAGFINEEDLQTVRERSRIEDVVGAFVTLRPAGGGALVGLCPFHDEKTPSFRVTPARGFYHCFGCGEGGDVLTFVQKINNVSFSEAVEYLADRIGLQLRYTDSAVHSDSGRRVRILEANLAAAEFFAAGLRSAEGVPARQFLDGRGFDQAAASTFGIGYAPKGGRALGEHLRARGFTQDELVAAGLVRANGWDFFSGRVLWPIRDAGRSVLGFGARRLFDDDRMTAKYLNTPETPVYKKSQVLYGLDLARSNIAKKHQAVVVEGYTDVMACHLAGVDTAVASCGTAFGDDHGRLLQRLIGATDAFAGEVIFTFDGDAAGQAAARKVFSGDQNFTSQTYVAIEPTGLDPCDLRLQHGDAALRELVGRRVPLYRFVMEQTIKGFDLDRVDGRIAALRAAAPLAASVRDRSLVDGYARELAQLIGMDIADVRREVRAAGGRRPAKTGPAGPRTPAEPSGEDAPPSVYPVPDPRDLSLESERATLRLAVRAPESFTPEWNDLTPDDFTHPAYRALFERIAGSSGRGSAQWAHALAGPDADPVLADLVVELAVEPTLHEPTPAYVAQYATKLRLLTLSRVIASLKSKLQRSNPQTDEAYAGMFTELTRLEAQRVQLQAGLS